MRWFVSLLLIALLIVGGVLPYAQCDAVVSVESSNHNRPHVHLNSDCHPHRHAGEGSVNETVGQRHHHSHPAVSTASHPQDDSLSPPLIPQGNLQCHAGQPLADHSCGLLLIADQISDIRREHSVYQIVTFQSFCDLGFSEIKLPDFILETTFRVDSHNTPRTILSQRNTVLRI